jgi:Pvc16 N-terminal domain
MVMAQPVWRLQYWMDSLAGQDRTGERSMIEEALSQLQRQLNQYLRQRFGVAEEIVALGEVLELDGSATPACANKLVLSLAGISCERHLQKMAFTAAHHEGRAEDDGAYAKVVMHVLCSANFSANNYLDGLRTLSQAICFIQSHPVLLEAPGEAKARASTLNITLEDLSVAAMNELWRTHGGRYQPSILCRLQWGER